MQPIKVYFYRHSITGEVIKSTIKLSFTDLAWEEVWDVNYYVAIGT